MPQLSPMMGILFLVMSVLSLLVLVISLRGSKLKVATPKINETVTEIVAPHSCKSSWI